MNFYKHIPGRWRILVLPSFIFAMAMGPAAAQNANSAIDSTPPVIELEELADGVADSSQVFTVQIAEETELMDATLFYRRSGQEPYTPATLQPLGSSGLFTVSITTDPTDLRPIEYYIQARDTSGNRTVSGFAFDPYSRRLAPALAVQSRPQASEEQEAGMERASIETAKPFYQRRWFQVTLGVIAVGALASSLDGGDEDTQLVPLTINLE